MTTKGDVLSRTVVTLRLKINLVTTPDLVPRDFLAAPYDEVDTTPRPLPNFFWLSMFFEEKLRITIYHNHFYHEVRNMKW